MEVLSGIRIERRIAVSCVSIGESFDAKLDAATRKGKKRKSIVPLAEEDSRARGDTLHASFGNLGFLMNPYRRSSVMTRDCSEKDRMSLCSETRGAEGKTGIQREGAGIPEWVVSGT